MNARTLIAAALVFTAMAVLVATGSTVALDEAIMHAASGLHGVIGDAIAIGVSRGLGFVGLTSASVVVFVIVMLRARSIAPAERNAGEAGTEGAGHRPTAGDALAFAVLMIVAALATFAIKAMVERPRPEVFAWIDPARGWSFPSGHALSNTTFWLGLAVLVRRRWMWALGGAMAVIAGVFRVVAGVHWPSDVVAGWAFGLMLVVAMVLVRRRLAALGPRSS